MRIQVGYNRSACVAAACIESNDTRISRGRKKAEEKKRWGAQAKFFQGFTIPAQKEASEKPPCNGTRNSALIEILQCARILN